LRQCGKGREFSARRKNGAMQKIKLTFLCSAPKHKLLSQCRQRVQEPEQLDGFFLTSAHGFRVRNVESSDGLKLRAVEVL
jgi:hypothetical protein